MQFKHFFFFFSLDTLKKLGGAQRWKAPTRPLVLAAWSSCGPPPSWCDHETRPESCGWLQHRHFSWFFVLFFLSLSLPARTSSNATPEQTLRRGPLLTLAESHRLPPGHCRCLWFGGGSTCAQGGWVHGAGAAQDIHSLTAFLSEKEKKSGWAFCQQMFTFE